MSRRPAALPAVGGAAPEFALRDLDGAERSLRALRADGPVLLAFYKASCPTCQLTLPYLERLHAGTGLRVVGISQDDAATTARVRDRFGLTFPLLLDPTDRYPVSNAYGLTNVPSLVLVEPDGTVALSGHGFVKADLETLARRAGAAVFAPGEQVPAFRPG